MNVGYAVQDITPAPGITLSGFAARCNRPSTAVGDPLQAHALVVGEGDETALLLVFDLLALGPEMTEALHRALDADPRCPVPRARRLFFCTHTHSAPATITLLGCGIPDPAYWTQLAAAAVEVAACAWSRRRPARLRTATLAVRDANYNRRSVLADGRVVMAQHPSGAVVKAGPSWDELLLVRFETGAGEPLAMLAHWAAHPDTICSPEISADFPGELRRRLADLTDVPCLFLQGACANLNPPFRDMTRAEMLHNVDGIMAQIGEIRWSDPEPVAPCALRTFTLPLACAPLPSCEELARLRDGMAAIAEGGSGSADTLAELHNILNVEPGERADPAMLRYIAGCMREWAALGLAQADAPRPRDLALAVLRLGPLAVCALAAEVFVETALALQAAYPKARVVVAGYLSPLVGYLPTDDALREGGYEVDFAYRFYAHPAPFAPGSEAAARAALRAALLQIGGETA